MKRFATLFVALGLATAGSTALADQAKDQSNKQKAKPQPVQMTDAQMDNVAAGLLTVVVVDAVDVEHNNVIAAVPVNVGASVAVLGQATSVAIQRPGQINQ